MTPAPDDLDAVCARVTKELSDPWMRVRCKPWCASDEPMNHGACDCGSQQFIDDAKALLAHVARLREDEKRKGESLMGLTLPEWREKFLAERDRVVTKYAECEKMAKQARRDADFVVGLFARIVTAKDAGQPPLIIDEMAMMERLLDDAARSVPAPTQERTEP